MLNKHPVGRSQVDGARVFSMGPSDRTRGKEHRKRCRASRSSGAAVTPDGPDWGHGEV